ncbi:MAG: fructose-bisphosphate aldolase [Spirochaetota bacterium]|nr:MAG: fructose-bisphosphate aldolase [Spirochaetota bacterium]
MSGKKRRLNRIFNKKTGRCVLAPIDHGIWSGPIPGIENPRKVLADVLAGKPDAVLLNPGYVRDVYESISPDIGLIVRVSMGTELVNGADQEYIFSSVERALRLDADGIAVTIYPQGSGAHNAIAALGHIIDIAESYELPVIAEFLPLDHVDWNIIAHMARIGYELGADIVKTTYSGDIDSYKQVVERCPTPIIVAGGDPVSEPEEVVKMAFEAVMAGAAGTAIGRNTWQNSDPAAMVAAICKAVHEKDLDAAKKGVSGIRFIV